MGHKSFMLAQQWAQNPYFDAEFRREIQDLIDQENMEEIEERFYKDIEFGTGGLRSPLGAGANRINIYTIRRATQALALEVKKHSTTNKQGPLRVAISYDCRHFSKEFAEQAARVLAANNIEAHLYNRLNPVPLLSYAVRKLKAQAGIMVTASHNPPIYNGFKVYGPDGAQVTPPRDQRIIQNYNDITNFESIPLIDFSEGREKGLILSLGEEMEESYYADIKAASQNLELCQEKGDQIKVVYTSIHGAGLLPCMRALKDLGLKNVLSVKEQEEFNGDFPTVKSPNPENSEALALAVKLMHQEDADLAIGSDPDGDRVGVALNHKGETRYLNGNQIGLLMLNYQLLNLSRKGELPKDKSYFVKSIVTSPLQEKLAKSFGVHTYNTLTGFKWICRKMEEVEQENPSWKFTFATEESFGYLNHPHVRDKDGVSSVALMAEICLYYKNQGLSILQALDKIYEEHGFSHEHLLSLDFFGKEGVDKMNRIMDSFRALLSSQEFAGLKIKKISDFKKQKTWNLETQSQEELELPSSNVLSFVFENQDQLFLRPSGTEPKIKFYLMTQEESGELFEKRESCEQKTKNLLQAINRMVEEA